MRRFEFGVFGFLCACQSQSEAPRPLPSSVSPAAAQQELERLDARRDVPLLPMMANHQKANMRDHLVAVQQIVAAAANGSFGEVEHAAARLGYSQQMAAMCSHMGMGAPGFTERAIAFHKSADAIASAARERDQAGVLSALGATLNACTDCHATFRQRVVDASTFQRLTASAPPHP